MAFALIALTSLLAGCAKDRASHAGGAAVRPGELRGESRAPEALWHLRAGLDVASLSCRGRGRASVSGSYHRFLGRHRALLDTAYRDEIARHGQAGYDSHATRLYNRFAAQRSPAKFCAAAAGIAREGGAMGSAELAAAAPGLLDRLERQRR